MKGVPVKSAARHTNSFDFEHCPEDIRGRALFADAYREQGQTGLAIHEYRKILQDVRGTEFEAHTHHRIGYALLDAKRYREALQEFCHAYELRVIAGADQSQLDASMHAISRAHELIDHAHRQARRNAR